MSARRPEVLLEGLAYPEGPLWSAAEGCLYFVEWAADRIWRLRAGQVEVVAQLSPGDGPSGLAQDADANLWVCLYSARRLIQMSPSGVTLGSVEGCDGQAFRGPNDLVLDRHGSLYFTDSGDFDDDWRSGRPAGAVYEVDTNRKVSQVATGLCFPNGLAPSPEEGRLIVAEHRRNRLVSLDLGPPGDRRPPRVLLEMDQGCLLPPDLSYELGPDGMAWDDRGRLWVAHHGAGRVVAVNAEGREVDSILLPRGTRPTNVAFDPSARRLYVTEAELGLLVQANLE